jgi:hypothetical protein
VIAVLGAGKFSVDGLLRRSADRARTDATDATERPVRAAA